MQLFALLFVQTPMLVFWLTRISFHFVSFLVAKPYRFKYDSDFSLEWDVIREPVIVIALGAIEPILFPVIY